MLRKASAKRKSDAAASQQSGAVAKRSAETVQAELNLFTGEVPH